MTTHCGMTYCGRRPDPREGVCVPGLRPHGRTWWRRSRSVHKVSEIMSKRKIHSRMFRDWIRARAACIKQMDIFKSIIMTIISILKWPNPQLNQIKLQVSQNSGMFEHRSLSTDTSRRHNCRYAKKKLSTLHMHNGRYILRENIYGNYKSHGCPIQETFVIKCGRG